MDLTRRNLLALPLAAAPWPTFAAESAGDIADRRELFVDNRMIERMAGVGLRLHAPREEGVAVRFDQSWEGPLSTYAGVFKDADRYRMYYRGYTGSERNSLVCYAESDDGAVWRKPNLGLYEWKGSAANNVLFTGLGSHNFAVCPNLRPDAPLAQRYLAIGRGTADFDVKTLYGFQSADGVRWSLLQDKPIMADGAFDSLNLAFWDPNAGRYACYYRIFVDGVRRIARAESEDFLHWESVGETQISGPREQLYTNATTPYFRAPHYYFSFPKRFMKTRRRLPDHPEEGVSDGLFLSSRDGIYFDRTFREALLRPGLDQRNWGDRGNMFAWGLVETGSREMSAYFTRNYRYSTNRLERGTFRLDGIASAHAGRPGELLTRALRFKGDRLTLNYSTSAAGSVRVEIQQPDGRPVQGFALSDAPALYGDAIDETYRWKSGASVAAVAGKPVRLRFALMEADLFSYRFADEA